MALGGVGMGTYSSLLSYNSTSSALQIGYAVVGVACLAVGISLPYLNKEVYRQKSQRELNLMVKNGAVPEPNFGWTRPAGIALGISITAVGITYLNSDKLSDTLLALMQFSGGIIWEGQVVAKYFSDQLPTPPSTKKPFWRTTYEMMRNKFQPKPQLEPAAEPTAQYATIDILVT